MGNVSKDIRDKQDKQLAEFKELAAEYKAGKISEAEWQRIVDFYDYDEADLV